MEERKLIPLKNVRGDLGNDLVSPSNSPELMEVVRNGSITCLKFIYSYAHQEERVVDTVGALEIEKGRISKRIFSIRFDSEKIPMSENGAQRAFADELSAALQQLRATELRLGARQNYTLVEQGIDRSEDWGSAFGGKDGCSQPAECALEFTP